MAHTDKSNGYPASKSSRSSSHHQSGIEISSWGTLSPGPADAYRRSPHSSGSYTPSSTSSRDIPYTFTYTPQEYERGLSPRPMPLSPPQGHMGWGTSSSSSSYSSSTGRGDGVHGNGGPTRPLLNTSLVWGQCSVSFDLATTLPAFHPSLAVEPAFPAYDGYIRILFRDYPTWNMKLYSRTSSGERISVLAFLKYLQAFFHEDMVQDQHIMAATSDGAHSPSSLPRMTSPQPSFGLTGESGPRVVDRRVGNTASGHVRTRRRIDFLGNKRAFIGLMTPQHPQDGSTWYVVFADAQTTTGASRY